MFLLQPVLCLIVVAALAWLVNTRAHLPENVRSILNVVLALIVVGITLGLINAYVPMAGSIKTILNIVVIAATCVWVLRAVGLWDRLVQAWSSFTTKHQIPG